MRLREAALLTSALALALVLARVAWTGSIVFGFLAWNLLLAAAPAGFGALARRARAWPARAAAGAAWLTFFPNAPYLVTDLQHLRPRPDAPLWFDVSLLAAFALAGLFWAALALRPMHALVACRFGAGAGLAMVATVCALSGFGVYLGRFLRVNSWDVVASPASVSAALLERVADPLAHPRTWGVTLVFGALLFAFYSAFAPSDKGRAENARTAPGG